MRVPNVHVFVHALIWAAGHFWTHAGAQGHSPEPHYLVFSVRYIFVPAIPVDSGWCSADLSSTTKSARSGMISYATEYQDIPAAYGGSSRSAKSTRPSPRLIGGARGRKSLAAKFRFQGCCLPPCPPHPISNGQWGLEPRHLTGSGWMDQPLAGRQTRKGGSFLMPAPAHGVRACATDPARPPAGRRDA